MRVATDSRSPTLRNTTKMSRIFWLLLLVCAIIAIPFTWADTQVPDSTGYPRTVVDDQQVSVTVPAAPERIISLAPSNTEMLYALGLDDQIAGVTDYCSYPSQATQKEKIGGFSTVSLEKVVSLKPDLVVAADGNSPDTVDRIRSLGIPVYYVDAKSLADIQKTLVNLGYLTGTKSQAVQLNENLTARAESVDELGKKLAYHPTVVHVIWNDPIYVSGNGTFQDELISLCGGINVFSDKEGHQIASIEEFINRNPDILMINSGSGMGEDGNDIGAYFKSEPRLSNLKAVKENHIITVDNDIADRAGPRLWNLLEQIAPKIREYSGSN
jgi:iron complex transport system substrate-binding protein